MNWTLQQPNLGVWLPTAQPMAYGLETINSAKKANWNFYNYSAVLPFPAWCAMAKSVAYCIDNQFFGLLTIINYFIRLPDERVARGMVKGIPSCDDYHQPEPAQLTFPNPAAAM